MKQKSNYPHIIEIDPQMHAFEYKSIIIYNDEDPMPKLNAEGKHGWEVVYIEDGYNRKVWLKRKMARVTIDFSESPKMSDYRDFLPKRKP